MKVLGFLVSFLSAISMLLGVAFVAAGISALVSSQGNFIVSMEPTWVPNDYMVWGLVLTIVGYLGLLRARTETALGNING